MPAPSFADVLDDALARVRADARRTVAWSAASGLRDAADPFVFARPLAAGTAWTRAYPRRSAPPPAPPALSVRRLGPAEQRALASLTARGARLTAAFTADELRREYRRLALRHHPDRQADRSAGALTRASAIFADVTDACRCLRRVVEPRH